MGLDNAYGRRDGHYNITMMVYVNYSESGNAPICGGGCTRNMGNKRDPF